MKSLFVFLLLLMSCYAQPEWIEHPPYGIVGFAAKNANTELQMRIALISAKAELAKERSITVQSESTLVDGNFSSKGTQSSFERIDGAKVVETYKTDDGDLYILVH